MIEEVLEFYAMQYLEDIEQVLNIMICVRGSPRVYVMQYLEDIEQVLNIICDRASARHFDM